MERLPILIMKMKIFLEKQKSLVPILRNEFKQLFYQYLHIHHSFLVPNSVSQSVQVSYVSYLLNLSV